MREIEKDLCKIYNFKFDGSTQSLDRSFIKIITDRISKCIAQSTSQFLMIQKILLKFMMI